MIRTSCLALTALLILGATPNADAQRRADVVQGVTSGELALTVEEMRVSNAELRARMTGIESDKAQLNGKSRNARISAVPIARRNQSNADR